MMVNWERRASGPELTSKNVPPNTVMNIVKTTAAHDGLVAGAGKRADDEADGADSSGNERRQEQHLGEVDDIPDSENDERQGQ